MCAIGSREIYDQAAMIFWEEKYLLYLSWQDVAVQFYSLVVSNKVVDYGEDIDTRETAF